jgi:hypothetical protein
VAPAAYRESHEDTRRRKKEIFFSQKYFFFTFIIDGLYGRELSCEGRINLKGKKKWPEIILVSFDFFLRSVIITRNGEKI